MRSAGLPPAHGFGGPPQPLATAGQPRDDTTPGTRKQDKPPGNVAVSRKLSFKEKKEVESLPAHIAALEAEQGRLQRESALPGFYKESAEHIRGVLARIEAIGKELETVLARWVELEDRGGL